MAWYGCTPAATPTLETKLIAAHQTTTRIVKCAVFLIVLTNLAWAAQANTQDLVGLQKTFS
jgi:hypothetical protein